MAFRVTNSQTTAKFIRQIFRQRELLENTRQEVATGLKVGKASDDPGRAGVITNFQSALQRISRHEDRIVEAEGFLNAQEGVLDSANNVLLRAKELASQAANETLGRVEREMLGQEVLQLRDQLVSLGNSQYQGVYLFAGVDDDDAPFAAVTPVYTEPTTFANGGAIPSTHPARQRYQYDDTTVELGNASVRNVTVADGVSVQINARGDEVFYNSIMALERLGRSLFGAQTTPAVTLPPNSPPQATDILTDLGTAYPATVAGYQQQTQDIRDAIELIDFSRENEILLERSDIGARLNRLEQAKEVLATVKLNTETARSSLQDADIFESASNLSSLQISLEGLLASGSDINNLTLLNFI